MDAASRVRIVVSVVFIVVCIALTACHFRRHGIGFVVSCKAVRVARIVNVFATHEIATVTVGHLIVVRLVVVRMSGILRVSLLHVVVRGRVLLVMMMVLVVVILKM